MLARGVTVAILAQGTHWAVAVMQAFYFILIRWWVNIEFFRIRNKPIHRFSCLRFAYCLAGLRAIYCCTFDIPSSPLPSEGVSLRALPFAQLPLFDILCFLLYYLRVVSSFFPPSFCIFGISSSSFPSEVAVSSGFSFCAFDALCFSLFPAVLLRLVSSSNPLLCNVILCKHGKTEDEHHSCTAELAFGSTSPALPAPSRRPFLCFSFVVSSSLFYIRCSLYFFVLCFVFFALLLSSPVLCFSLGKNRSKKDHPNHDLHPCSNQYDLKIDKIHLLKLQPGSCLKWCWFW